LDSLQNEMENLVFKGFSDEEKDLMKGFLERIDENLK